MDFKYYQTTIDEFRDYMSDNCPKSSEIERLLQDFEALLSESKQLHAQANPPSEKRIRKPRH